MLWFRGHKNVSYKLNSGLYRISKEEETISNKENDIFNCFINYGDMYCSKYIENKDWNTLFLMQHYGLYTRLLDWTDSLITSLYFATRNHIDGTDACIWVLNPISLNQSNQKLYEKGVDKGFDNIGLLSVDTLPQRIKKYTNYFEQQIQIGSFSIVPRRNNERLISQNGFFTVQGTSNHPLEEEVESKEKVFLKKIILSNDFCFECKDFLKISGINYYSLYGGIEGLCYYIKNELLHLELKNL
ncbi:MAG: FRG domain-containing protein [Lachnospiraceae bacterium]|nr:FRG domain-containing protein [Lachnospiraceae bacterium]